MCLPDSLQVLVGETFTAYLGVLNVSRSVTIRRLSVSAHLQTPSQRFQLPSPLEAAASGGSGGVDVPVGAVVDTIVSHAIEEAGQHILRIEVSYASVEGGIKTFRKFYRFQVVNPLSLRTVALRAGDQACWLSITVEYQVPSSGNNTNANSNAAGATAAGTSWSPMVVTDATFVPTEGLVAKQIGPTAPFLVSSSSSATTKTTTAENASAVQQQQQDLSATQLLDASGWMTPGSVVRYLFLVQTNSDKGLAAGDKLGTAVFTWRKSMGEQGRIASPTISCPAIAVPWPTGGSILPPSSRLRKESKPLPQNFVVHRSGLSVDVAALAAVQRSGRGGTPHRSSASSLSAAHSLLASPLPVTVDPIHPPRRMTCHEPTEVQFYVVNHAAQALTLQLQFRLSEMTELTICGPSFVSLGTLAGQGGSTVVKVHCLPLATGLLTLQGCWIVDLASDHEIPQPPLFHVFVDKEGGGIDHKPDGATGTGTTPLLVSTTDQSSE